MPGASLFPDEEELWLLAPNVKMLPSALPGAPELCPPKMLPGALELCPPKMLPAEALPKMLLPVAPLELWLPKMLLPVAPLALWLPKMLIPVAPLELWLPKILLPEVAPKMLEVPPAL